MYVGKPWPLSWLVRLGVWSAVGLVGMHVAHKTNTSTPWVWATFEHVDNLVVDKADRRLRLATGKKPFVSPTMIGELMRDRTNQSKLVRDLGM